MIVAVAPNPLPWQRLRGHGNVSVSAAHFQQLGRAGCVSIQNHAPESLGRDAPRKPTVALAESQRQQSPKVAGYAPLQECSCRRRSLRRHRSLPAKAETSDSPVITVVYRDHAKTLRTVQRAILSRLLSEHHTLKWARAEIELDLRPQPQAS